VGCFWRAMRIRRTLETRMGVEVLARMAKRNGTLGTYKMDFGGIWGRARGGECRDRAVRSMLLARGWISELHVA